MTLQSLDTLIYKGKVHKLLSNPIDTYLKNHCKESYFFVMRDTACSKGYNSEWEIIGKKLYLTSFYGRCLETDPEKINEKRIEYLEMLESRSNEKDGYSKNLLARLSKNPHEFFASKMVSLEDLSGSNDKVFASWYTGTLSTMYGKSIRISNWLYYEKNLYMEFKDGIVQNMRREKNNEYINKKNLIIKVNLRDIKKFSRKNLNSGME
ncbi:MAG TPA: hypothetical protein DCR46_04290 [Cytophagales bacterium]|mgnify:CR=1 FL=1|nr:hypothetical protein [Cytophagales bacterium]